MPRISTENYDTVASWNGSQDLFIVEQPDGTKVATPAMVKQFIEAGDFEATGEVKDGHGNILSGVVDAIGDLSQTGLTGDSVAAQLGTAGEQIAGLIKNTGERILAFSNGNCTIDLTTIDASAHELLAVYAWGPDVPLSFSLVNWNLRRYKIFHLSNTSYTGNLAVCLVYRTNPQA